MALPRKTWVGNCVLGLMLASSGSLSAFAAIAGGTSPQDIYSATEPDTLEAPSPAKAPAARQPRQAAGVARTAPPAAPSQLTATAQPAQATSHLPDSALSYDLVPSDQLDPLAKRLQLVELLIRRHARAYDYRTHTVRELGMILAKLDAETTPVSQAQLKQPTDTAK